jgi:hypothetical protein
MRAERFRAFVPFWRHAGDGNAARDTPAKRTESGDPAPSIPSLPGARAALRLADMTFRTQGPMLALLRRKLPVLRICYGHGKHGTGVT